MSKKRPDIPKDLIEGFCRRNHIRKLSIFGSYLREDFGPESDIDFLVEFDPEHIPGLIRFAGMEIELSELLGGQKVDLRTPHELSRYFRDEVLAEAEVKYAEG
ncbi:MAG: nucleotidyltransferase family protein [Thermodesulfobacteriota bacterium]